MQGCVFVFFCCVWSIRKSVCRAAYLKKYVSVMMAGCVMAGLVGGGTATLKSKHFTFGLRVNT